MEALLKHASEVYAFDYFGIIIVVSLLEGVVPRRRTDDARRLRWSANFGIAVLDTILIRSLFPLVGIAWATLCRQRGWGLFNELASPGWLAFVLTVIALDGASYAQHYLFHRIPVLWRLHRAHHTDQDFDFSTNVRTHPFETILETSIMLGAIFILGAPPLAVFLFQVVSLGLAFVDHANVYMPPSLDRVLRLFIVTPDMHRIHHSQDVHEGRSNLANIFPGWDRLFGTYVDQPAAGHDQIAFGVAEFTERKHLTLHWMLAQPFLSARPTSPTRP